MVGEPVMGEGLRALYAAVRTRQSVQGPLGLCGPMRSMSDAGRADQAEEKTMTRPRCLMPNCNRTVPSHEAMCKKHR